jgi:hypothetical protein
MSSLILAEGNILCMVERNERESVLLADLSALRAKEAALQEQVCQPN